MTPGSTPPDSAQTSGLGEPYPRPRRKLTPTAVVSLIALALFVLIFAVSAVYLLAVDMPN